MNKDYKSKALAPTTKDVVSEAQAMHNDYSSPTHGKDVFDSLRKRLVGKGFDVEAVLKLSRKTLEDALAEAGYPVDEDDIDISGLERIEDLRDNLCFEGGSPTQKTGEDWLRFFIKNRQLRSKYKTSSGNICEPGKTGYSHPIKQTFFRLPPWLAMELDKGDEAMVKRTVIEIVEIFKKATGLDVIAANIHKEANMFGSSHDLHVHLMYSPVVKFALPHVKTNSGDKRQFINLVRNSIRAELKAEGKDSRNKAITARIMEKGITAPATKFGGFEYRRIRAYAEKGREDWPTVGRKLNILGSAYRNKASLVEACVGEDREKVLKLGEPFPTAPGSFTGKFLSKTDPSEDYLDYWLEEMYTDKIYSRLSDERKAVVDENQKTCIANYIEYGTSVVDPVEEEYLRLSKDLREKKDELAVKKRELEDAHIVTEQDMVMNVIREVELEYEREEVTQQFEGLAKEKKRVASVEANAQGVLKREGDVADREDAATTKEGVLHKLDIDLGVIKSGLVGREEKLVVDETKVEGRIKVAKELEDTLSDREDSIRDDGRNEILSEVAHVISPPVPFRVVAIHGVSDLRVKIQDHTESAREAGRREILDEVSAIIPPSIPEDSKEKDTVAQPVLAKRTRKEVLKDVAKVYTKARIWDKMKTHVETFVKKVESFKKPLKWMSDLVREIKTTLGMKDDPKDKKDQDVDR